jgi:Ca2+-binding RTX toxin-like protein
MNEPTVYTGPDDDTVTTSPVGTFADGGDGNDTFVGRGGPDRLTGSAGTDDVRGGGGADTVGGYLPSGITTLTNTELVVGAETDTLTGIERAAISVGSPFLRRLRLRDGSASQRVTRSP